MVAWETLGGVGVVLLCHAHGRCCPDTLIPHLPDHVLVWSLENSRTTGAPSRPEKPASGSEMEPAGGTADLSVSPSPEASGKAIPQPGILGRRGNICAGECLSIGYPFGVLVPLGMGRAGFRGEMSGQPALHPQAWDF